MAGFGEELRAERMRQMVTLETMSAETRVNLKHFEAIERNDLLALPGGVFRKGIVRAYLAALHLEEETWLARYQATWDSIAQSASLGSEQARQAEQDAWATFATNIQRARGVRPRGGQLRWLGVLGLFLALAAAALAALAALRHPGGTGLNIPALTSSNSLSLPSCYSSSYSDSNSDSDSEVRLTGLERRFESAAERRSHQIAFVANGRQTVSTLPVRTHSGVKRSGCFRREEVRMLVEWSDRPNGLERPTPHFPHGATRTCFLSQPFAPEEFCFGKA